MCLNEEKITVKSSHPSSQLRTQSKDANPEYIGVAPKCCFVFQIQQPLQSKVTISDSG